MASLHLHFPANYDHSLAPIPASRHRDWWDDNSKTANHAKHCLPLVMANSLGYYILCPGTFIARWNGNPHESATVEVLDPSSHCIIDNHAAFGSFTIQASFIPRTEQEGDYLYVKGVANERGVPYSCMEACIEAWWSPGNFGLVYLLNRPGEFLLRKGQPIAQMFVISVSTPELVSEGPHPGYAEWQTKRSRPDYRKDLDYMTGKLPSGCPVPGHVTNWKAKK